MKKKTLVLVVDDDAKMATTLCDILELNGHEAICAFSGREAVEKVMAADPDCVLMDYMMPGISGVETLRLIRNISRDLPVVLMSGNVSEDWADEAKRLGAYAVLNKPFNLQMLLFFLSLLSKEQSILIVDDDLSLSGTVGVMLRSRGYRVESRTDGEGALKDMEEGYKLAVIIDMKVGDEGGLSALKTIRSMYPTKPVLLVTTYGEDTADTIRKGLEIGAYTCLYRPFEIETLVGCIREIGMKKLGAALGEPFREKGAFRYG